MCELVYHPVCVCVCVIGERERRRAKRPLPRTQIITWFYNVAYLYSGQFPAGARSWNNNAGHFTPASRRPFSALILSMDLTSFPKVAGVMDAAARWTDIVSAEKKKKKREKKDTYLHKPANPSPAP